jgi:methylaspartate ammonia-lyase
LSHLSIEKAFAVPVSGGYYNEDLDAIRSGARKDGFVYAGTPVSPGFDRIKEPSEAVSIVLVLDNGQVVAGDALSVEFAAAGGRSGRFRSEHQLPHINLVCEYLEGLTLSSFLEMCDELEARSLPPELHMPAAMYGASQALLQAVAIDRCRTAAEVLAEELGVSVSETLIPINIQTGEERHTNVDRAILKKVDVLPHGLINDIDLAFGADGQLLAEYVSWVVGRIETYGSRGYQPELHLDVYGLPGIVFDYDIQRIADYLADLGRRASPYELCVEMPIEMQSREEQITVFAALRSALAERGSGVNLVVDEWANSIQDIRMFIAAAATDMINVKSPDLGSVGNAARAVLACWEGGIRPILGGSCTDTDQSARVMAHVALAVQPAWVLARPGMGVDEGFQIVKNEMARTLAIINTRSSEDACPSN